MFYRLLIILLAGVHAAAAQDTSFRLVVCDASSHEPVSAATIKIKMKDGNTAFRSGITSPQGIFSCPPLPDGSYMLHVRSLGYPDTLHHFTTAKPLPDTFFLSRGAGLQLKEVTVHDNTPPVQMQGDTIVYNANKFRTKENAVVEDLLRKLPGVKVGRDGSIKAQGETVQRVLVDGKEFFGSDPAVATRNLPADMIDKVQVLDKKSEMAEFTGVADGQEEKTINLVTKKNRKRGYFGNTHAGAGTDDRYEGGLNVNSFRNDLQLSLLAKGNNVNKSGFSASELIRYAAQNRELFNNLPSSAFSELMRMKGVQVQGNPEALAELARPTGYTDVRFGGVNFNNDWKDRFKWRSSYFFNESLTRNNFDHYRKYRFADTAYNYQQSGNTDSRNTNHRISLSADVKFSQRTSLKISPRLNATISRNGEARAFRSFSPEGKSLLNEGEQHTNNKNANRIINTDILFRHRLGKAGRTLVLHIIPEYFRQEGRLLNRMTSEIYNVPGAPLSTRTDQQTRDNTDVHSVNGNVVYTEPLSATHSLQIGQRLFYSDKDYDRQVMNRGSSGLPDQPDPLLSDLFSASKLQYNGKLSLAGMYKKLTYTAGLSLQQSTIHGSSAAKGYNVNGRYRALLPEVYAEWKTRSKSKLTFRYEMNANAPGVAALQPLEDNSDPLYVRRGNPALQQEKSQRWTLSYNQFDIVKGNNMYMNGSFTFSNSAITDSTSIDVSTGRQLTIPVNVRGNYNAALTMGKSYNIGKNGSSFSTGINIAATRNTVFNNGVPNRNLSFTITPDISLNYYLGDRISLALDGSAAYNTRRFSGARFQPEKNWMLTYGLETNIMLPLGMMLEANADCFSALGMATGYNNNIVLVNTALVKDIAKGFSLRAEARDLFNKNESISRITGNGFIEDRKNNALGRYFLLSLTYKFRHFPKPDKQL